MATRTIPTADEVRACASRFVPATQAVHYEAVRTEVQKHLRTTCKRSFLWLTAALLPDDSDLLLISTSANGTVFRHFLDSNGRENRQPVEGDGWRVILDRSGTQHGVVGTHQHATAQADTWIITASLLVSYIGAASAAALQEHHEAERLTKARRQEKILSAAYLEENHGDALAVLRGLFARAGVLRNHLDHNAGRHDQTVRAACGNERDGTRYAEAVITLRDDDINAVAGVLAELGITPADEPELTESDRVS